MPQLTEDELAQDERDEADAERVDLAAFALAHNLIPSARTTRKLLKALTGRQRKLAEPLLDLTAAELDDLAWQLKEVVHEQICLFLEEVEKAK